MQDRKTDSDGTRILYLAPITSSGGAENAFCLIANRVLVNAHRCVVGFRAPEQFCFPGSILYGLDWSSCRDYPIAVIKLARIIKREKIDIIFSFTYYANLVAVAAQLLILINKPLLVINVRTLTTWLMKRPTYKKILLQIITRLAYQKANLVLCNSAAAAYDLNVNYGISTSRIHLVKNPIDIKTVKAKSRKAMPSTLHLTRRYFLGLGRFSGEKGFCELIEAFAQVVSTAGVDLVLVGSGPEERNLRNLVDKLGITSKVHFPGWISNPYPVIRNSICLVLPSHVEGFPNVVLEAMAIGTPVVATLCTSWIKEFAAEGALKAVPVGDTAAIAACLFALVTHSNDREAFTIKARTLVGQFAVEKVVSEYERYVYNVLKENKHRF